MSASAHPAVREGLTARLLIGPATVLVLVSLIIPLLLLGRYSLNKYDSIKLMVDAFSAENYIKFITDSFYSSVLVTTIMVAAITTALCLILGYPIAYRIARMQSRWKSICMLAVILPLFIGSTVRALGWMAILGHGGIVDGWVRFAVRDSGLTLLYTPYAVALGILSINLPFMVLTLQSVIEGIDRKLEEAADSLGASPFHRFFMVLLPLSMPGVLAGGVLVFILAMNAYATPLLLGGPKFQMMAPMLYREYAQNNNWPFAAAIAFILVFSSLSLTALSNLLARRRRR